MKGHGRGYYGSAQLAPVRSRGRGWISIAVAVGIGAAVIWILLPSAPKSEPEPAPSPAPPGDGPSVPSEAPTQMAHLHGFPSTQAYEDHAIARAKELRAAGWQVALPAHLQHLEPRVVGS